MKNKLITALAYALLISIVFIGFYELANYNTNLNHKIEIVSEEYDVPVNILNKRCGDGMSIDTIEEDLASGDLVYHKGQLIYAEYIGW